MKTALKSLLMVSLIGLGACTTPTKTFHIDAVNTKGEQVKCLIVVEHRWPEPGDKTPPYFTPADVPIEFASSVIHVQVKDARIVDGKPEAPKAQDRSKYKIRGRDIKMGYPSRLTLILER